MTDDDADKRILEAIKRLPKLDALVQQYLHGTPKPDESPKRPTTPRGKK